ncbi:hypothetical protein B2904_orf1648 [Brachyspira pilosicoli B2904]|uniref:Lipoprotein n=1 Tax=Brachyspira pilosicoli B2904 TaxID=1133568 RepID=J9UHF4_BRAPL|nr:hypothetical protein [Brachyspira pilosicoli]AFR70981.1 hypothetical protein B2904_orf1648 [Brachyspira pilosicoli B2904]
MTKKIFLLLFTVLLLSIMFISCKKFDTTATNIQGTSANPYISIDPILGQDYKLQVETKGNQITIGIVSGTSPKLVGDAEVIDKLYQEKGSSNYSFQNGVMSGNFSILSTDQIKISFVRNTPPYLSVRDIICTSAKNP